MDEGIDNEQLLEQERLLQVHRHTFQEQYLDRLMLASQTISQKDVDAITKYLNDETKIPQHLKKRIVNNNYKLLRNEDGDEAVLCTVPKELAGISSGEVGYKSVK